MKAEQIFSVSLLLIMGIILIISSGENLFHLRLIGAVFLSMTIISLCLAMDLKEKALQKINKLRKEFKK